MVCKKSHIISLYQIGRLFSVLKRPVTKIDGTVDKVIFEEAHYTATVELFPRQRRKKKVTCLRDFYLKIHGQFSKLDKYVMAKVDHKDFLSKSSNLHQLGLIW